MARRSDIDWEMIERDYRIGQLTIRMMEEKYRIDKTTISRRAKKDSWSRDLTEQVRLATQAKVTAAVVENAYKMHMERIHNTVNDVDAAANVNASIIMRHQKGAEANTQLMEVLTLRLQDQASKFSRMDELLELLKEKDPLAAKEIYKAISLSTHINELKQLTEVHANIIKTERQAFSIDAEEKVKDPEFDAQVMRMEAAKRAAELAARGD